MRIVTLSNGKKVANFSSPHPFTFTDGSVLPAVLPEVASLLQVTFNEDLHDNGDVKLSFDLSEAIIDEMAIWLDCQLEGDIDVVFCPLPMITAIKESYGTGFIKHSPFRTIRIEDRINKLVSIDKQCI
jgi:hypothetical protein